jgi:hypothetical protein
VREALATADSDLVRQEPRARSSRRPAKPPASGFWQRARGKTRGKHRLALVAGVVLAAVVAGILANALLLQKTRHPAPLLGQPASAQKPAPARVAVRPQRQEPPPAAASDPSPPSERVSAPNPGIEAPLVAKPRQLPSVPQVAVKPSDPIGQLLKSSGPELKPKPVAPAERRLATAVERRPAAPVERRPTAPSERRLAAPSERRLAAPGQTRPAAESKPRPAPEPRRAVAAAQRALVKLGFVLEADGVAGPTTRQAIERYERDRGLPARGVLSPDLARRLGTESGVAIE